MTDAYRYCINETVPNSDGKKASYVYRLHREKDLVERIVLSPLFQSYHAVKSWIQEAGFVSEPQFKKLDGTWSEYIPFRLKKVEKSLATYRFANPLKKTQKLILPPKIVEIDNEPKVPEIGMNDQYIQIFGKIEKA